MLATSADTSLLQSFILVKSTVALYPATDHNCTASFPTFFDRLFTEHTPSQSGLSTSLFHRRSPSTPLKSAGNLPHADPFPVLENVRCCRAVHSFPQYIHSNIMVNNSNYIPDGTQFSDLFIKTTQYSHFSASTKYEISFRALLTSFESHCALRNFQPCHFSDIWRYHFFAKVVNLFPSQCLASIYPASSHLSTTFTVSTAVSRLPAWRLL